MQMYLEWNIIQRTVGLSNSGFLLIWCTYIYPVGVNYYCIQACINKCVWNKNNEKKLLLNCVHWYYYIFFQKKKRNYFYSFRTFLVIFRAKINIFNDIMQNSQSRSLNIFLVCRTFIVYTTYYTCTSAHDKISTFFWRRD